MFYTILIRNKTGKDAQVVYNWTDFPKESKRIRARLIRVEDLQAPRIDKALIQICGVKLIGTEAAEIPSGSGIYSSVRKETYPISGVIADFHVGTGTWEFDDVWYEFAEPPEINIFVSVQLLDFSEYVTPAFIAPGETVKIVIELD